MKIRISELRSIIRDVAKEKSSDSICYGNPAAEFMKFVTAVDDPIKEWFISSGLIDKICSSAPKNDSDVTLKDLEALTKLMNHASEEDISFAEYVEKEDNIAKLFIQMLNEFGVEESLNEYYHIDNQTLPLLHYLKHKVNRPRPYQLAYHFGLDIFPLVRTDAMTASYPSGHALVGFVMSEYYSRKHPHLSYVLKELGEKVARSREIAGIHYPSDTEASRLISKIIFKNDLLIV